jgi:hypothetical protein
VTSAAIFYPEGLCQWKIPMAPSEIETSSFRLVAQYLKQLRRYHGINRLLVYGINFVRGIPMLNIVEQNIHCAAGNQGCTKYMSFTEHFDIIKIRGL